MKHNPISTALLGAMLSFFAACSSSTPEQADAFADENALKDTVVDGRIPESVANPVSGNSLSIFLDTVSVTVEFNQGKKEFKDLAAFEKFLVENNSSISREGTRIECSGDVTIERAEELMEVLQKNGIEKWSLVGM